MARKWYSLPINKTAFKSISYEPSTNFFELVTVHRVDAGVDDLYKVGMHYDLVIREHGLACISMGGNVGAVPKKAGIKFDIKFNIKFDCLR